MPENRFVTKARFHTDKLVPAPEAEPKFYERAQNGKDRFGNRFFSSPDLGYIDRKGDAVKAGMLVSPEGVNFLRTNQGILNKLDAGLTSPKLKETDTAHDDYLDLGDGVKMAGFAAGGQSMLYMVKVGDEYYILKTKLNRKDGLDASQPYINEMLEIQSMGADLKDELAKFSVVMPECLFASGQMMLRKYEAGQRFIYVNNWSHQEEEAFSQLVRGYIKGEIEKRNPLWENVKADLVGSRFPGSYEFKADNFIKREDGKLVWFDPFVYREKSKS